MESLAAMILTARLRRTDYTPHLIRLNPRLTFLFRQTASNFHRSPEMPEFMCRASTISDSLTRAESPSVKDMELGKFLSLFQFQKVKVSGGLPSAPQFLLLKHP